MVIKPNILRKTLSIVLLFTASFVYGQSGNIAINSSGVSPNSSAILDLSSNSNGGFLLPSLSSAQIAALTPISNSLLVYNNTSTCYEQYYATCSCWQAVFCPCNNPPTTPTGITGNASPCAEGVPGGGSNFYTTTPYSVSPVNDATSYSWIITPNSGGTLGTAGKCGSDIWTGFTGDGGLTIGGTPLSQDITWWQGCTYTLSVAAVNACGSSATFTMAISVASNNTPPTPTVTGSATICTNSTLNTYTASAPGATSFTWTVPVSVGTITSGAGTGTVTVTGSAGAGSGTISVTATGCGGTSGSGTYAVTVSAPPPVPTIAGPTNFAATSTGNTFTATSAGATSFTWTVPAAVGTITSGQGTATITVTGAAGSGSGNITVTATGSCGTSASSLGHAVTVGTCGTITADATAASGDDVNSFTITTTQPNDLVIISCNGYPYSFNGSVSIVPPSGSVPTATKYASVTDGSGSPNAAIAIYYFVATSAGAYTINVNEGSNWGSYNNYANFAVALTGFCGIPSSANIQNPSTVSNQSSQNCQSGLNTTLTEIAGSYAIGSFCDFWCNPAPPSNPTWTNLTSISGTYDGEDAYGFAGKAIAAGATPTITATQSPGENYGVLYLIDIH